MQVLLAKFLEFYVETKQNEKNDRAMVSSLYGVFLFLSMHGDSSLQLPLLSQIQIILEQEMYMEVCLAYFCQSIWSQRQKS